MLGPAQMRFEDFTIHGRRLARRRFTLRGSNRNGGTWRQRTIGSIFGRVAERTAVFGGGFRSQGKNGRGRDAPGYNTLLHGRNVRGHAVEFGCAHGIARRMKSARENSTIRKRQDSQVHLTTEHGADSLTD